MASVGRYQLGACAGAVAGAIALAVVIWSSADRESGSHNLVSVLLAGSVLLSPICAGLILNVILFEVNRRRPSGVSTAGVIGCAIGGTLALAVGLFAGLVIGGSFGVGWGQQAGRAGAYLGLPLGFVLVATFCIVTGGLVGFSVAEASRRAIRR